MFPPIVASPVVSSLNQPWLQGRGRVTFSSIPRFPHVPLHHPSTPPNLIMGESSGKDDESGSLAVWNKDIFKVVYFIPVFAP